MATHPHPIHARFHTTFDVCPWWIGYLLINPLRGLLHPPESFYGPWLSAGMTVLEPGPGMGWFTLPMAERVGPRGRVVAVDLQEGMLKRLQKRAARRGLSDIIETRHCEKSTFGVDDLAGSVDFVMLTAMVHEVPDQDRLWREVAATLKPTGRVMFSEPAGHVSDADFQASLDLAAAVGLMVIERPRVRRGRELRALLGPSASR